MKAKAQAIADKAAAMSGGDDDRGVKRDREGDDMLPPDAFENPAQRQRTSGFDAPPAEGAAPEERRPPPPREPPAPAGRLPRSRSRPPATRAASSAAGDRTS